MHTMTDGMLNGAKNDYVIRGLKEWANSTHLSEELITRVIEELASSFWLSDSETQEILAIQE